MTFLRCRVCGLEEVLGTLSLGDECPRCGAGVTKEKGWDGEGPTYAETGLQHGGVPENHGKPAIIHALPFGHPNRVCWSTSEVQRVMEREGLMTHPADESGIKSPLGEAPVSPRKGAKPNSWTGKQAQEWRTRYLHRMVPGKPLEASLKAAKLAERKRRKS